MALFSYFAGRYGYAFATFQIAVEVVSHIEKSLSDTVTPPSETKKSESGDGSLPDSTSQARPTTPRTSIGERHIAEKRAKLLSSRQSDPLSDDESGDQSGEY